jgi:hypothetical protein
MLNHKIGNPQSAIRNPQSTAVTNRQALALYKCERISLDGDLPRDPPGYN